MALPILSNWLSKKIRYSFMATIVFRFMIGSNVLYIRLNLLKRTVQGQLEFSNSLIIHALMTQSDCFNSVRCMDLDTQ